MLIWQKLRKLFGLHSCFAWLMERRSELFPVWFLKFACCVRLYLFWIDFVVSLHSAVLRYYSAFGNQFLWKLTLTYANFPDEKIVLVRIFFSLTFVILFPSYPSADFVLVFKIFVPLILNWCSHTHFILIIYKNQ